MKFRRLMAFCLTIVICLGIIPIDGLFMYTANAFAPSKSELSIVLSEDLSNGIKKGNEETWFRDGDYKIKDYAPHFQYTAEGYVIDVGNYTPLYIDLYPAFYYKVEGTNKNDYDSTIQVGGEIDNKFIYYVLVVSLNEDRKSASFAVPIYEEDLKYIEPYDLQFTELCRDKDKKIGYNGIVFDKTRFYMSKAMDEGRLNSFMNEVASGTNNFIASASDENVLMKYIDSLIPIYELFSQKDSNNSYVVFDVVGNSSNRSYKQLFGDDYEKLLNVGDKEEGIEMASIDINGSKTEVLKTLINGKYYYIDSKSVYCNLNFFGCKMLDSQVGMQLLNLKNGKMRKRVLNKIKELINSQKKELTESQEQMGQETTAEALEKARKLDKDNNTCINEWFWKINYFFANGVCATKDVAEGGLGVDGPSINDFGYIWTKSKEVEDALAEINQATGGESAELEEALYKYDKNSIGIKDTGYNDKLLTLEEDLRVRTYFNILAQYMYFEGDKYEKAPYEWYGKEFASFTEYVRQLANTNYGLRNALTAGKVNDEDGIYAQFNPDTINIEENTSTSTNISRQKADAAAESKFKKVSDKPSYYSAAVNFDSIVSYFAWGAVSNEKYADKDGNTGDIKYNENIEYSVPEFLTAMDNQLSDDSVNLNKTGLSFNALGLPKLTELGKINRNMHSYECYGKLNTALMFIRQYAEIAKTKGSLEGGKNTAIDDGSGSEDPDIEGAEGNPDEGEEEGEPEEGEEGEATGTADAETWYYNTGAKGTFSNNAMLEFQYTDASKRVVEDVEKWEKSELKEGIKCPDLESFINKNNKNDTNSAIDMTDDVAKIIAAYIHIHDGLDILFGGEDKVLENTWLSPELKRIYLYYDEIKKWQDEPAVDTATNPEEPDEREAFRMFFQFEGEDQPKFTDHYATGVALSATYIPLVTNLYDPESLSVLDDSQGWVDEFHYKYGFNRKALFIDSDEDAAVKAYVTGEKSGLKVATLKDLLQPEKDIVLYIDTNMYNINKVADMQQLAYSRIQNSEEAGTDSGGLFQSIGDGLANFMEIGAENIYKSGAVKLYANKYASGCAAYGTDEGKSSKGMWFKSIWSPDNFIMSTEKIEEFTYADEYQPMQGAAFTCGIYRDKDIYNICQNQSANPHPVFVSSASLAGIKGQQKSQFNTIFNYLMLKNISNNKQLDSEVDIDEDTPLFIDIYGNISTQSGLVVIPAACNATLYVPEDYNVATAGFLSIYNKFDSVKLPERYGNADKYMGDYGFILEQNTEDNKSYWSLDKININGNIVYARGLGLSSNNIRKALYSLAKQTFSENQLDSKSLFDQRVNMIMEVMRGAPLEHIDFEKEGLSGVRNIDKTAIYVTYRVEQLSDLFTSGSNGNSLVELPNLAYMSHIEYVVVFLFKALFSIGIFILMVTIYVDGVGGVLGWKTILKFMLSIMSIIIGIIFVPSALNVSYYQTNKWLLQSEMTYMNMINTEKKFLGKETGIVEVRQPESNSELFLKLDEVRIPWYVVAEDIFNTNQFQKMNDIYNEAFQSSIYMAFEGVVQKGNGLYISIDDLLESSTIVFNNYPESNGDTRGFIFQVIEGNQEMSYVLPYYFILDQLLFEIQKYNEPRDGASFVTKFKSNGDIMTYGLIEPYLLSNDFLQGDSQNLLGLFKVYGQTATSDRHTFVLDNVQLPDGQTSDGLIEQMHRTLWYQGDAYESDVVREKLLELDYEARKFVVQNRFLLNKVSDETFIKCMALHLAIKHNDIFGVPAARSYEVMNLDTRDIMRMSLAPKNQVMKHASKSFANFVLSYGGFFAVCATTMLIVMYWLVSLVKPLLMIILLLLLIVSYIYNKLIRRQNNKSFEGYLVSITLMCLVNILYALSIKISIWIPSLEVNALISILIQVVVQFLYIFILLGIGYIVVKNAADIGFYTYKTLYDTHMANKIQAVQLTTDRLVSKLTRNGTGFNRRPYDYGRNTRTAGLTGNDIMRRMQERDEELRNGRFK